MIDGLQSGYHLNKLTFLNFNLEGGSLIVKEKTS